MSHRRNCFPKTLFVALALISLFWAVPSQAGKKNEGPFAVYEGAGLSVQAGLGAKEAPKLSFVPDYQFSGGGIELPIERTLQPGDRAVLRNTTGGSGAQDAWLLVERRAAGGLLVRLVNYEGFNYRQCSDGDGPAPGLAQGKGGGKACAARGLSVSLPGELEGSLAKINLDQGLSLAAYDGKVSYRLAAGNAAHLIDADTAVTLRLAPGKSLEILAEPPPAHKFLASDGKLLYHLAELQRRGPALGQGEVVGELTFTAEFEVGPQGDGSFKRKLRPGDVLRIRGGEAGQDFACAATEANQGSLLLLSRLSPERPLHSIQINEEEPISLREDSTVAIVSKGGAAGYQSSGAGLAFGLPEGKNYVVQSGEVLRIELFTKLAVGGGKLLGPEDKPGFGGAQDLANPVFPPDPDPQPGDGTIATPAPSASPSAKGIIPGEFGAQGGGWSCGLHGGSQAGPMTWGSGLAFALMGLFLLRRTRRA
ncbi:MAG: hypothetical protein U1F66_03610 [bacterium]